MSSFIYSKTLMFYILSVYIFDTHKCFITLITFRGFIQNVFFYVEYGDVQRLKYSESIHKVSLQYVCFCAFGDKRVCHLLAFPGLLSRMNTVMMIIEMCKVFTI